MIDEMKVMTALMAGSTLSTTQLGDLPGNKLTKALTSAAGRKEVGYKTGLKINIRRAEPSEHFLKATTDTEASSPETEDDDDSVEEVTRKIEKQTIIRLADIRRTSLPSSRSDVSSIPLNLNSRKSSLNFDSNSFSESTSVSASVPGTKDVSLEKSFVPRPHVLSESRERQLLEDLQQIDEEEENKINNIQTDDDSYFLWKSGESRKASKAGVDSNLNKRNKTAKPVSAASRRNGGAAFFLKPGSKFGVLSAWETVTNHKRPQRARDDRKQRSTTNYVQTNKVITFGEKNSGPSDHPSFMFFHYTDTARYIEQYRSNHNCENPHFLHPACCHEKPTQAMQEFREPAYPFKLDFQSNSFRSRLSAFSGTSLGYKGTGNECSDNGSNSNDQSISKLVTSPNAGYLSPVAFRPTYLLKSPPLENWSQLPESPSRLKYQLKKMWHSVEQNPPAGAQRDSITKALNRMEASNELQAHKADERNKIGKKHSRKFNRRNNNFQPGNVDTGNSDGIAEKAFKDLSSGSTKEQKNYAESPEKSLTIPKLCDMKLDERHHQHVDAHDCKSNQVTTNQKNILQEDYFHNEEDQLADGKYCFNIPMGSHVGLDAKSRHEHDKNLRMKSLIAAEITTLQKRQVINVEQKKKLDKFKQALSTMSNPTAKSNLISTLPPNGSATKRFIAGSVRAYYTRTANQERFVTECVRPDLSDRWCDDVTMVDRQEDKPMIVVSQPHLRHLATETAKTQESKFAKKKLIGGKIKDRKQQHPADAKQFTRITDLLRIKKRQQSSRRVLSGSSTIVSNASARPRHSSAHSHVGKQRRDVTSSKNSEVKDLKSEEI